MIFLKPGFFPAVNIYFILFAACIFGGKLMASEHVIQKIISGGQTGVDRAALDVGLQLGIPLGGACPKRRWAEDGVIDTRYPLYETESSDVAVRTFLNVQNSDGTLILYRDELMGGTAQTLKNIESLHKPYLLINLDDPMSPADVLRWIQDEQIQILNIAGPRESTHPGIYQLASAYLSLLFHYN
jgi:Circularly permutated YpsA SLOG family